MKNHQTGHHPTKGMNMSRKFSDLVEDIYEGWDDKTVELHYAAGRYFESAKVQREVRPEPKYTVEEVAKILIFNDCPETAEILLQFRDEGRI